MKITQNKSLITIFSFLLIVVLAGAGCFGGRSAADQARDAGTAGDASRVPLVESELDLKLPAGSEITGVIDNPALYSSTFLSSLSVNDARDYFIDEFTANGMSATRPFGTLPTESDSLAVAVYKKGAETWAINIRAQGNGSSIDIQKQ